MSYIIRTYVDIMYVGDGAGTALLGINQSNNPGFDATLTAGPVGVAQTLRLQVNETVPGGNSPSGANFNTALTAAATALGTLMTTAGAYSGGTDTPLAIAQGWATGNP